MAAPQADSDDSGPQKGDVSRLLETVVDGGYCIGCGTCAAVEGSPLGMSLDGHGRFVATLGDGADAEADAVVGRVCPFSEDAENEDALARTVVDPACHHDESIGYYLTTYVGQVIEDNFRAAGSSGGMGTWILCELLSRDLVDGVLHVQPRVSNGDEPLFSFSISRTPNEVRAGAKSRYYPVTMAQVLTEVRQAPGRYAIVGTPCFVKAARLLCNADPQVAQRLRYFVGLVCGHLKSTHFADMFAWQVGIKPGELSEIDFRKKLPLRPAWDYGVRMRGRSDTESRVSVASELFGHDWGWGFFKYKACDYCDDVFAETADVTVGDAWLEPHSLDAEGTNVLVVRNQTIARLVDQARAAGRLHLFPLPVDDVARSQEAGLRHRREGLAYRLHLRDQAGEWRPRKRVEASDKGLKAVRQRIHRLRESLAEKSHIAFAEAVQAGDFTAFKRAMESDASELPILHKKERRAQKPVNSLRRLPKKIERFLRLFAMTGDYRMARSGLDWNVLQGRKNLYVMQPIWSNMGDQAQSIATERWLRKHYGDAPLVALNVVETRRFLGKIARLATPDDIIFIQSGGNLGDHWIDQEQLRRQVIQAFPNNRVVVLSNTIFFSDTESGREELATSRKIYGDHPNLVVMARDPVSYAQALNIFSKAQVLCVPDFVLSMSHPAPEQAKQIASEETRTLLLLRHDRESTFSEEDEQRLLESLPGVVTRQDTDIDEKVTPKNRAALLRRLIDTYHAHDLVVTNRLHGAIFSVLARRPCVVLPTVDHKLSSAAHFLRDVPFVKVSPGIESIAQTIEEVLSATSRHVPDYSQLYFDRLPEFISSGQTGAPFDGAAWESQGG